MGQYGIFVRSALRSLAMLKRQRNPITRSWLRTAFTHRNLREILFIFGTCHRGFGKIIPHPVRVDISPSVTFVGIPVFMVFRSDSRQLENGGLRRKFRIRISMSVPRHTIVPSKKWKDLRARCEPLYLSCSCSFMPKFPFRRA